MSATPDTTSTVYELAPGIDDALSRAYMPFALNVISLRGPEIANVTAFIARSAEPREPEAFERYPEEPPDATKVDSFFGRFGLPARLD